MESAIPPPPTDRVDERDTMFARMARRPDTPAYRDYYERRPDLKRTDDRLRGMPTLGQPGGRHYDPTISVQADEYFEAIYHIMPVARIVAEWRERIQTADDTDRVIREMFLDLGAVAATATRLDPSFIYSFKGRFDENYGQRVRLDHPMALVFLVEMDYEAMQRAPLAETIRESARQYFRAAEISMTVVEVLKSCGYEAKAHYDAHYDVILPPLAVMAGLGELGRNNILVADGFGSRVRIGAVTTNLTVTPDRPVSLGVEAFCRVCKKCSESCPSTALSSGEKTTVRGVPKWPTDTERCYGYWRSVGSDCGICMAVCPFSHRNNRFHNFVRRVIRRLPWTARLFLYFDDLFYGRDWKPADRS
jgi:reductive dehalogenase